MQARRHFISRLGLLAGSMAISPLLKAEELGEITQKIKTRNPSDLLTKDEEFWQWIRQAYTVSSAVINLNNGGVSPQPSIVQEAQKRYLDLANETPSFYMWRILDQNREPLREKLADLAGCSPEEIALNRNATEALDTAIFGLSLQKGDEVILTKQDYPNMIQAWKQREMRDGIHLKWINLDLPQENDEYFVQKFTKQFTAKTKIVHITHIINWTGQILPVRKIADEAHKRGIEVVVDSAHAFAHLNYKIPDLGADYFGTSLHKWLCAPYGTGMLYVKKEKIAGLYPLFPNNEPLSPDIRKFETQGTRSFPAEMATAQAIDFHNLIGSARKQARLQYLKNYWIEKCLSIPRFKIHTSLKPEYACALAIFSIEGIKPEEVSNRLYNEFKIHSTAIVWENISGVRITPHVYTTLPELDKLVRAIGKLAES
ncbi:MAG: aminotransferase class V-fold PLP-dependent enzyme [Microscillaceae bacterium]|nr:aminotransferase class V-fold PLP-dependent enzyme [Microscillaceae bacterium]